MTGKTESTLANVRKLVRNKFVRLAEKWQTCIATFHTNDFNVQTEFNHLFFHQNTTVLLSS